MLGKWQARSQIKIPGGGPTAGQGRENVFVNKNIVKLMGFFFFF